VICDPENLRACSLALSGTWIDTLDFASATAAASAGDLVYFDPPYVPLSATAQFTSYARGGFNWESQEQLASVVAELTRRNVRVMLSNSDVPALRELYRDHRIEKVRASRRINSKSDGRGMVDEILVMNY
jgi:DNA adenine methylase